MINQKEYKKRRDILAKSMKKNSIGIVLSASQKTRSNDTEFPYRQNSNFYYLTGFKEDSAALVIVKESKKVKTYLFVAKKVKELELWTGKRLGREKAKELFDFDEVYEYEDLSKIFQENLLNKHTFYYDFSYEDSSLDSFKNLCKNFYLQKNLAKKLASMRLIKSDAEIALIKKALKITKEAHHKAMQIAPKLDMEYELQAELEYVFKKNGAYNDAYTSIVACANSANTLHYISNSNRLEKGELILIDAGCEYDYYSSDITRTIPVSGEFSGAQKELYEMVLSVEKEIIAMMKPGVLRTDLQKRSEELLCEGMIRLGIIQGSLKKLLKKKAYKQYYPHGIGHWMGLDVHDQAAYKTKKGKEIPLKAGMIMTVEPGIYLDNEDTKIPKKYRGIGIRIEDDILVTEDGHENLSYDIYKEIDEIESMKRA